MDFQTKIRELIKTLIENIHERRKLILALSCVVVFVTTYVLILPAFTLDKEEAAEQGGIDVPINEMVEKASDVDNDNAEGSLKEPSSINKNSSKADSEDPADPLKYEGENYSISIADKDNILPNGTEINVEEINKEENSEDYEEYYNTALSAIQNEEGGEHVKDFVFAQFYDISLMSGNDEVQPENGDTVNVKIEYDKDLKTQLNVEDDKNLKILHFSEDTKTGELTAEVLDAKENNILIDTDKKDQLQSAEFDAGSFSVYAVVYTVDFTWEVDGKTYEFRLPGGGYISLEKLIEILGVADDDNGETNESKSAAKSSSALTIEEVEVSDNTKKYVEEVEKVEFSDKDLVWVKKIDADTTVGKIKEDNKLDVQYSAGLTEEQINEINEGKLQAGDWALISLKPFESEEYLTVTMKNGGCFMVKVTDAANPNDPLGLDGKSLAIINNRDGGSSWQSLNGAVDNNKDSRGYYMSGNDTSYSPEGGVDYSSYNDVFWSFEYVSSDSNGSYYRISTSNGYLYIDPNVTKKSDMPSNTNHAYVRALRLESSAGNGSPSDGTLIRVVPNGDGTYMLQNRNGVCLWNYGGNTFWLSTVDKDGENATSIANSRFRLALQPLPPHVTIHYVDRNGKVLTGVQYNGTNTNVIDNEDGTFIIPYNITGDVDLRAQFDFSSVGENKQKYTYANTHLAGKDSTGDELTYEGYVIDSVLTGSNGTLKFKSDTGETSYNYMTEDPNIVLGNLNYGSLKSYSLSDRIYTRPTNNGGTKLPYALSNNKDIYVILDPLPNETSASSGNVDPGKVDEPALTKSMESNNDGTYTLSLKVDAHASNAADTNKANVLFVVDTSSSMRAYTTTDNQHSRITDTHDAVRKLGSDLLAYNASHPDAVEVSMITFDGSVVERQDWTKNVGVFQSTVDDYLKYYYLHTGTDWEDSLQEALDKLLTDTDEDPTFVIFFTDGEPSQYKNFHGAGENTNTNAPDPITHNTSHESVTGGYPNFYSYFLSREASKDEMRAIVNTGAQLYAVYAYNPPPQQQNPPHDPYHSYYGDEGGAEMLHNALKYGYNTTESLEDNLFFKADDTDALKGAFDKIFNLITEQVGFSNVVVKDGIAAGVTSTSVLNGDVSAFTYTIKDENDQLAYQVTVAPNGVPEGTTPAPAAGTPIFKLRDGSVHIGEIRSVPTTKITGSSSGSGSNTIQTETVDVDVYYFKDDNNNKEYIMPISTASANISWDLAPLGILNDGYSYEVSFVVWPKQGAYDLVADLNNGKRPDLEENADWNSCPIKTDSEGRKYRQGGLGEDYSYISRYEDTGIYAAMSNTDQMVDFYKVDKQIVEGEEVSIITGPNPTHVDPPDPMPLTASKSRLEKIWNVERDPSLFAELLYGSEEKLTIPFAITRDNESSAYMTVNLGWDNDKQKYIWDPDSEIEDVPFHGGTVNVGTRWVDDFNIATGLMVSEGRMEELGLNKGLYTQAKDEEGNIFYILETGHDYSISEPNLSYEYDFEAPVYHPMLVDNVLKSVNIKTGEGGTKIITSMTDIEVDENGVSSLVVENTLRGYIHVDKVVVDEDGNPVPEDKNKFKYNITLQNERGPFDADHIPWYAINGLFYRDEDKNYYQVDKEKIDDDSFIWKLKNENGDIYTVTSTGFDPDQAEEQTITYRVSEEETKTLKIFGNQMTASNGGKTVTAEFWISQTETLSLANIPVGTTYTITESDKDGYTLKKIEAEVRPDDLEDDEKPETTINGSTIDSTIVTNHDNYITYTNTLHPGALKLTKFVRVDGSTPADEDLSYVDGNYIFTVTNADNNDFEISKYVQITVTDGTASSYKIADSLEGLSSADSSDGSWALLTGLAEGDYIVTETADRNGLMLTDLVRGDEDADAIDHDGGSVTVHVKSGDTAADELDAQAKFTNDYYKNIGPDRIALDIVKTFEGLSAPEDLPDDFYVVVSYARGTGTERYEFTLSKGQNGMFPIEDETDHITIKQTTDGYTYSWHITNIPSDAKDFKIKETNYDSVAGYSFISAYMDGNNITETADEWHAISVQAPEATLSDVTGDRRTSDSGHNLEFILEDSDILLSKLTANQGTMVISRTSLNTLEREAIKNGDGWPNKGGFDRNRIKFFSFEEHPEGFEFGGKTVTFGEENGKLTVSFSHNASAQEYVYIVTYNNETHLNNAVLTNTYKINPITLELIKVDSDGMTIPLEGAKFELNKLDPETEGNYITGEGAVHKESNVTGTDGSAVIAGLMDGYYEINEIEIPDGYVIVEDGKFYIKIKGGAITRIIKTEDDPETEDINEGLVKNWPKASDNTGNVQYVSMQPAVVDNPDTGDVDESREATTTYKVGNTFAAELPMTGGIGTTIFYILGSILVIGGGIYFVSRRRMK